MLTSVRTFLLVVLVGLFASPADAQRFSSSASEVRQTRMLQRVFATPMNHWREGLRKERDVLDKSFFDNVERRIQWALEHGHLDDALRFAIVGDLAAEEVGFPSIPPPNSGT